MDNQPSKPASARNQVRVLKVTNYPRGQGPRGMTMARMERQAARRKWLLISAALAAALVVGVLIGRFLLP
jgi:hypothetical protein